MSQKFLRCRFFWSARTVFVGAFLILLGYAWPGTASAQLATPSLDLWVPDGSVYAISVTGTKAYVGGNFYAIGPSVGHGLPVDRLTGAQAAAFPKVDGLVRAAVSDGVGGWYIGGDFTKVGELATQRLAHVKSDGTVDSNFVNTINN